MEPTFAIDNFLKEKRGDLQNIVNEINDALDLIEAPELGEEANIGEVFANLKLALRHAEDARMRLGKVYQALDGGNSIYDK